MCVKGQRTNNATRPIKLEFNDVALFKIKNLNVFWWNVSSVSNKKKSTALKIVASVSPHLVSVVYYNPEYFFCFVILFFSYYYLELSFSFKKKSYLNRNIIKKKKYKFIIIMTKNFLKRITKLRTFDTFLGTKFLKSLNFFKKYKLGKKLARYFFINIQIIISQKNKYLILPLKHK
jgi:hypothetical protein